MTDLGDMIEVGPEKREKLIETIRKDADFCRRQMILDYSLLVGIHYKPDTSAPKVETNYDSFFVQPTSRSVAAAMASAEENKPFYRRDMGGMLSVDGEKLYYMGIIDVLTKWNTVKRVEHSVKSVNRRQAAGVSCVHPDPYAERFVEFISERIS
uniref:PIPK domain-containing protein n=1 Tax=Lankesteria abbotti TaxID=340204 RepID=A0A7S2QQZ2_9APIC